LRKVVVTEVHTLTLYMNFSAASWKTGRPSLTFSNRSIGRARESAPIRRPCEAEN
jgi:hypothetical protein